MSLQGNLTDLPLEDLLQVFAVQNRTGTLSLRHANFTAEICFNKSALHSALIRRPGDPAQHPWLQGEEAIYEMLGWAEGDFVFELNTGPTLPQNIFHNANYIVLENLRRRDERDEQQRYSTLATICPYLLPNPPVQAQINLELEQWRLLFLINGRNTIEEMARVTGRPLGEVIPLIMDLEKKGLIELPKTATPAPPPPTPQPATSAGPVWQTPGYKAPKPVANPMPRPFAPVPAVAAATAMGRMEAPIAKPKVGRSLISGIVSKIRGL